MDVPFFPRLLVPSHHHISLLYGLLVRLDSIKWPHRSLISMHEFGWCLQLLLVQVQFTCACGWTMTWPFESRHHDDMVVTSTGVYGNLYEIELNQPSIRLNPRPGERRDSKTCPLGSLIVAPHDTVSSLVCWHRFKVWWMRPVFGNTVPPETTMILFQDDHKRYRVVIAGDLCSLRQDKSGVVVVTTILGVNATIARLYCGMGTDPYSVIRDGMEQVTRKVDCTRGGNNNIPSYLGWCTWNAFYTQIDGTNLVQAVQTLLQHTAPVRWIILDDGWQHTTNDHAQNGQQWKERLVSLKESPSKFQDLSLRDTITQLKTMGLDEVWVWHTLMGYWLGVNDGTLYYPHFPSAILDNDKSASREASVEQGIGIPSSLDFFETYHDYLQNCGVSGVKVDAQGIVGTLQPYKWNQDCGSKQAGHNTIVSSLHEALAKSVQSHFGRGASPKIIHCMCHDPEIIFQMSHLYDNCPFMRASDDHYPDNPYSHGPHVVTCAFNSLLLSHVTVPDWDMFTTDLSDERIVRLHAVSRCLSGGLVYISDLPSRVNRAVVNWVCCSDGTVLTCREAGLPIAKCLLSDPLAWDSDPFIIFNTNGRHNSVTSGVFGVFHLAGSGTWDYERLDYGPVGGNVGRSPQRTVRLRPTDIPHFAQHIKADASFLALPFFFSHEAVVLPTVDSEFILKLEPLECDAITILPIHRVRSSCEIVVLGIKGRINGSGSILDICVDDDDATMSMTVQGCGILQYGTRPDVKTQVQVDSIPRVSNNGGEIIAGFSIISIELDASDKNRCVSISISQG